VAKAWQRSIEIMEHFGRKPTLRGVKNRDKALTFRQVFVNIAFYD
jgi:hypothetical protein